MTKKMEKDQTSMDFPGNLPGPMPDGTRDKGAGGPKADRDFYGPVFLVKHEVNNDGNIYWVDNPHMLPESAAAVMVRHSNPGLGAFLSSQFQNKPILVAPMARYWVGQGKLGWEIYSAKSAL